jgi:cell division protein FtsQ
MPPSRDPAPSRLSYRMQRWMLTPGIRLGLRIGMPMLVAAGAVGIWLSDEVRRDDLTQFIEDTRASIQERPEFMVSLMAIDGAGDALSDQIRNTVPINFPVSSFDLDLEQIRLSVAGLDPVKTASVRIRPGGILEVQVTERTPAVVWRTHSNVALLDETGAHIHTIASRASRADLPLIAGEGAKDHVAEALTLINAAAPLGDRLRGLVRIGERRWDVVLDRDQRILLPAQNPLRALERVIALSEAQDMLERDVAVVDMRLNARPTLRMSKNAMQDWWRIREINGSGQ